MNDKLTKLVFEIEPNEQFSKHLETAREAIERLGESLTEFALPISFAAFFPNSALAQQAKFLAEQELQEYFSLNYAPIEPIDWDNLETKWTLNSPERWEYESLVDWGNRLERAGLLGKYEYRLMYGKECWRAILWSPVWYAGEVWTWLRYEAWEVVRERWTKS